MLLLDSYSHHAEKAQNFWTQWFLIAVIIAYQSLKSLQNTIALEERKSNADDGEGPDLAEVVAD